MPVIKSAVYLEQLYLGKNFMKSDVGKPLARLLKSTTSLQKLSLEFNELSVQGMKWLAKGLCQNASVQSLSVKGNLIGDEGLALRRARTPGGERATCALLDHAQQGLADAERSGFRDWRAARRARGRPRRLAKPTREACLVHQVAAGCYDGFD